jgi:hypothetical protein
MIFGTYFLAGFVLLISAYLFKVGALTATTHTLFWGCILGSEVMIFWILVAWFFGVNAKGKGLEDIAAPLTSVKTAVA